MAERLSAEDSRILALESRSIVGHTCKVVIAERTGDGVTYLRDRIARRIALAPSCRRRIVVTPRSLDAPVWADDPNFDVRRHVRKVPVASPVGDAELREIVAGLMAERLPRDRPLWAIDVVEPLEDGTRAVIWRIHHAMADGQAAMAIGSALLWSESTDPEPDPPQLPPAKPLPSSNRLIAAALSDRARAVGHTAHGIGRRVASRRRLRESLEELRGAPSTIRRELVPERRTSPSSSLEEEFAQIVHVVLRDLGRRHDDQRGNFDPTLHLAPQQAEAATIAQDRALELEVASSDGFRACAAHPLDPPVFHHVDDTRSAAPTGS